jgi:hypothetical protein
LSDEASEGIEPLLVSDGKTMLRYLEQSQLDKNSNNTERTHHSNNSKSINNHDDNDKIATADSIVNDNNTTTNSTNQIESLFHSPTKGQL